MARADIGTITCPVCEFPDAHVREANTGRAYVLCEECGQQTFSRSTLADKKIRAKMRPIEIVSSASEKPESHQTETAPVVEDGEEKTIFDVWKW